MAHIFSINHGFEQCLHKSGNREVSFGDVLFPISSEESLGSWWHDGERFVNPAQLLQAPIRRLALEQGMYLRPQNPRTVRGCKAWRVEGKGNLRWCRTRRHDTSARLTFRLRYDGNQ